MGKLTLGLGCLSGGCGEAAWRVWGGCLVDVGRLSEGVGTLSVGVGRLSEEYGEAVWEACIYF